MWLCNGMYDFVRAFRSSLVKGSQEDLKTLYTPWGEKIDPHAVRSEYPRPQMKRDSYQCLNGYWEYAITSGNDRSYEALPKHMDGKILVPFSPEAPLSGVMKQLQPNETLWYKTQVELKKRRNRRILLHFEAVDYECTCYINGKCAGSHTGAYVPFTFDITELIQNGRNELVLAVQDASEYGLQPRGKQRLDRGTIWYTAQSGIWQPVWMEEVSNTYITCLDVVAHPDTHTIHIEAEIAGCDLDCLPKKSLKVKVLGEGRPHKASHAEVKLLHRASARYVVAADVVVDNPHVWTPEDPYLYDIEIRYGTDCVMSYCAFRVFTVEFVEDRVGADAESESRIVCDARTRPQKNPRCFKRFCLNHKPLFLRGLLDQGYWPDGLLTAPSDEAMMFDITLARDLGFTMLRKHIKVEPSRWYYHCDKLGIIVWQDLVNGCGPNYPLFYTNRMPTTFPGVARHVNDTKKLDRFGSADPLGRERWLADAQDSMFHLRSFACIATWTVFNEGWGQFDADVMLEKLRSIDATRPFDQTSGWFDQRGGDYVSEHNYFRDLTLPRGAARNDTRARVISEFGGFACFVPEHSVLDEAYGYDVLDDFESLAERVNAALAEVDALEEQGLSAYVYTQLSDVEEEANGLISYDRKVLKYKRDKT